VQLLLEQPWLCRWVHRKQSAVHLQVPVHTEVGPAETASSLSEPRMRPIISRSFRDTCLAREIPLKL
jgi:hypothetical protein